MVTGNLTRPVPPHQVRLLTRPLVENVTMVGVPSKNLVDLVRLPIRRVSGTGIRRCCLLPDEAGIENTEGEDQRED